MNNFDITQKIIFNKIINHTKESAVESAISESEMSDLDVAYKYLNKLIEAQVITSARPVTTSRKGILGKIAIVFKKVVRKATYWYVEPICKSQTFCNEMTTQVMIRLFYQLQKNNEQKSELIAEYNRKNEKLSEALESLKEKYDQLCKKCEQEQSEAFELLKEKYDQLCKKCERQSVQLELMQAQSDKEQRKLMHVSEETRKVVEDMQTVKREAGELFKANADDFWNKVTVAQSGEDAIIAYILMVLGVDLKKEQYLDLGANHAKQLNNTYMLYQKGMRGVLVEANPKLVEELRFFRDEDIIVNKCIANKSGESIDFYVLNGDGLSSMDLASVNDAIAKNPMLQIEKTIKVEAITVGEIMQRYFQKPPLVLNVDVEGMEEEILDSIDYDRYAPLIIVVERIEYDTTIATEKRNDNISEIMDKYGYFEYAFTGINSIFINKRRLEEIRNENRD